MKTGCLARLNSDSTWRSTACRQPRETGRSLLRAGPSCCPGQGGVLRAGDAGARCSPQYALPGGCWASGGRSVLCTPSPILTSVVPPEPTRETWEDRNHPLGWPGFAPKASVALVVGLTTRTSSSRVVSGERWPDPPQGPNLLGSLLILVGILVVSKNIRDSGQGLRRNEKQKNSRVSESHEQRKQTAQAAAGPWRTGLGNRSPKPPAFSLGGFLGPWFMLEIRPVSNSLTFPSEWKHFRLNRSKPNPPQAPRRSAFPLCSLSLNGWHHRPCSVGRTLPSRHLAIPSPHCFRVQASCSELSETDSSTIFLPRSCHFQNHP